MLLLAPCGRSAAITKFLNLIGYQLRTAVLRKARAKRGKCCHEWVFAPSKKIQKHNCHMIKCLLTELQSVTLELGSIEGITLTCCARPLFPFPPNVSLELGQVHQNTISKQHWKRQRQVSEQCDPCWVSSIVGRAGPESIWLSARTHIWCCPDLEPHIFPSGPPIQSVSTYDVTSINNHRSSGFRSNHWSFIATVLFRMVRKL